MDLSAKITGLETGKTLKLQTNNICGENTATIDIKDKFAKRKWSHGIGKKILLGLVGATVITGVATTLPNVETAEARHRSCGGWGRGGGWDYGWDGGWGRGWNGDLFLGSFAGNLLGNVISNALTPRPTYYQEPQPVYQGQYQPPQVIERVIEKPVYIYNEPQPQHQQYSSQPYQQPQQLYTTAPQQNPQPVVFAWSTKTGGRYMDTDGYLHQKYTDAAGNTHDSTMGYLDADGNVHQRMLGQNNNVTDTVIGSIYRNDW